ncbi:MAG TPA: geranyl transferase, partial [Cupriavidus sp.]|nr:geranyl transferase [Cupriavidus sp.]
VGATPEACDAAACAVEMIHAYSLVHDDMPCMDDDDLRRGRPTVHKAYDEATALLVGDALQSQAFIVLAQTPALAAEARLKVVAELAVASGSVGMCGGQAIDLQNVGKAMTREALEGMHRMKTGALLRASVRMGALCGNIDQAGLVALDRYAAAVGLAFQVVDDILDVTADTATLGKTAGKDAANDKPTYVSLLGLDAARELAAQLRTDAHEALEGFGARAGRLAELADLIVLRSN